MDIFMHFQLRFKAKESCRVQKNSLCNAHIALHLPFIMCAVNQTPKRRLIKPDLPCFILRRRKTHFDLRFCVFFLCQKRQFIQRKIFCLRRFRICREPAAGCLAQYKYLANAISIYGLIMLISVLNGNQPFCNSVKPGLLLNFFNGI